MELTSPRGNVDVSIQHAAEVTAVLRFGPTPPTYEPLVDCEPIPLRAYRYAECEAGVWQEHVAGSHDLDIDGDGIDDLVVPRVSDAPLPDFARTSDGCGIRNWDVYLRRGTCGHWVGALPGRPRIGAGKSPEGLVDLEVDARDDVDVATGTYAFDGVQYLLVAVDTDESRCHGHDVECPTSYRACTVPEEIPWP
jgi:hypothetical protein